MFTREGKMLVDSIKKELDENNNSLSIEFISKVAKSGKAQFSYVNGVRICVILLPTGHSCIGYAQVLDPAKDDEERGNEVAYDNAVKELWSTLGAIAKLMI